MKVMCVEGFPNFEHPIIEGEIYEVANTVTTPNTKYYYLVGQPKDVAWSASRFMVVDEPPKAACPLKKEDT